MIKINTAIGNYFEIITSLDMTFTNCNQNKNLVSIDYLFVIIYKKDAWGYKLISQRIVILIGKTTNSITILSEVQ